MSFWEDLSPGVKRYAIVAAVLLAALFAFRHCGCGPNSNAPPQPRGVR